MLTIDRGPFSIARRNPKLVPLTKQQQPCNIHTLYISFLTPLYDLRGTCLSLSLSVSLHDTGQTHTSVQYARLIAVSVWQPHCSHRQYGQSVMHCDLVKSKFPINFQSR